MRSTARPEPALFQFLIASATTTTRTAQRHLARPRAWVEGLATAELGHHHQVRCQFEQRSSPLELIGVRRVGMIPLARRVDPGTTPQLFTLVGVPA
ncbi:hypothetical protein DB30_02658 [Enhygromyxa salina]|uniref:Uncharacterized protein n=1 Tax=Enhygromyxa salina TaxID=215803 RepID=A0A0C2DI74_9BACT|nr:hypothetical protein DB30_02658 [Enhygromyxa salina]